jgi:hypothetical protein
MPNLSSSLSKLLTFRGHDNKKKTYTEWQEITQVPPHFKFVLIYEQQRW